MPLVDDPLANPLTLRGFNELPAPIEDQAAVQRKAQEAEEAARPVTIRSPIDKAIAAATALVNPAAAAATYLIGSDVGRAAFRNDNTVVSAITKAQETLGVNNDLAQPNYSAWDEIAGTKYEQYWRGTFMGSNNANYTKALMASIDRQEDDRRTVAAGGWSGTAAGILAGTIDPTILIPGGGEIVAGKGMWTVGRGALAGARAGAVGVAAQEALLQGSQDVRPLEESALNVGAGVVLGAVLGGGLAGALAPIKRIAAEEALTKLDGMTTSVPGSVGAAATEGFNINDLTISGGVTERLAKGTAITPNLRGNFREAPLARQSYQELASNPLTQRGHLEGKSLGGSVEDNINVSLGETLGQALESHAEAYSAAKKTPGFGMTSDAYDTAIGEAMHSGDVGVNDQISAAAKLWRAQVFDPLSKQAVDLGMMPEDLDVKTALSYFSRQYNQDAMIAKRPEFIDTTTEYLNGLMKQTYAEHSDKLRTRTARLDQEAKDLQLSPEERAAEVEGLQQRVAQLEADRPNEVQLQSKINAEQGKLRNAATGEEKAKIKENVKALRDSGGEEFKNYLRDKSDIAGRRRAIDFNVPGLAEKSAKIEASIANTAESNQRALMRILNKGQRVAKELRKYDEVKLAGTISDLRTQFHQLIEASNAAQDRFAKTIETLKDAPELVKKRLETLQQKEASRFERLNKLDERLQAAEGLDYKASVAEIKASIDEMIKEVSEKVLTKGERVKAWRDKMAALDPEKVKARLASVEELKKEMARAFADRWETGRLGKGVDPHNPNAEVDFTEHAKDLAVDLHNRIVGNDYGTNVVDPQFRLPIARGPLKDRTFFIPDEKIEGFLEKNVVKVATKYARSMAAQIELTRKFGDVNMAGRLDEIEKQYDVLMEGAETEKDRLALDKDRKGTISDLQALRDLTLGTYLAKENASTAGRVVRGLMNFNYIRSMGGAALPSVSDIYGPAMFHGLGRYMEQGVGALMDGVVRAKLVKEAKYAGIAENLGHHRLLTMAEIGDPYARGNAVERFLDNMTHVASKWNGLNMLTNFEKEFTAIVVQDHLNEAIMKGTDKKFLAWSGIDDDFRSVLKAQLDQYADNHDGVLVANTDKWDNWDAVRAYRVAIARSVNSDIVTRGIGDIPLAWYRPMYRLLTQFKTFNLAAHQRMFLRATQLGPAQFASGMIGLTTIGMFATTLKALRGGEDNWKKFQESYKNPGYMIGEGLDQSGFFTLPLELSNMTEKASATGGFAFNPVKSPLLLAGRAINPDASLQGNTQKFNSVGPWGAVLGPSAGLTEDALRAAGGAQNAIVGDEVTQGQKKAAARLVPYQSYLGMKEMLQLVTGDSPY